MALIAAVKAVVFIVVLQLALGVVLEVMLAGFQGVRGKRRRRGEGTNVLRKGAESWKSAKRRGRERG